MLSCFLVRFGYDVLLRGRMRNESAPVPRGFGIDELAYTTTGQLGVLPQISITVTS